MMRMGYTRLTIRLLSMCIFLMPVTPALVLAADIKAATPSKKPPIGSVPGSFENLFNFKFGDVFWENGRTFTEVVKNQAQKKSYWQPKIYDGATPAVQYMGDQLGAIVGGAFNTKQFAKYVELVNENGDPGLAKNPIFPRVIVGVVTPVNISGNKDFWHRRLEEAGRVAKDVTQKYAASHGAAVFEIVRVAANDGEVIYSEGVNRNVVLKDAFIITVGNRYWQSSDYRDFFATNESDLEKGLSEIFTQNWHISTDTAWLDAKLLRLEKRIESLDKALKFLNGLKQEDLYPGKPSTERSR